MAHRIGFDQETHRIAPGAPFPRHICATFAQRGPGEGPEVAPRGMLVASGDAEWPRVFTDLLDWLDNDPAFEGQPKAPGKSFAFMRPDGKRPTREVVAHNGHGFDLPVVAIWQPRLMSQLWRLLERGHFRETLLREKLLNLAQNGVVDYFFTPDGMRRDIRYRLSDLVRRHYGIDLSGVKGEGADDLGEIKQDAWRLNYDTLDGLRREDYPDSARDYAIEDAVWALQVSEAQDRQVTREFTSQGAQGHDRGVFDPFRTEALHVGAMFALSLATQDGFGVDAAEVEGFKLAVAKARRPEQLELLFQSGLLERPRLFKSGPRKGQLTEISGSTLKLRERVVQVWGSNRLCDEPTCKKYQAECDKHGLGPLKRTEPTSKFPEGQISCDSEVLADLGPLDPVLDAWDRYTAVGKMADLEIPRLEEAIAHGGVIHGGFDDFKLTSRVSSRRSKFYPSVNVQQLPRGFVIEEIGSDLKVVLDEKGKTKSFKIEPRHAYMPRRAGNVLVSIDYSFIELVTAAQMLKRVIGYSVLLDKINKGFDPHAFLGAQLAYGLDETFSGICLRARATGDPDAIYGCFERLKGGADEEKKLYKLWRGFAKPVGLGLPGGLGARTLIVYAKKVYGVTIKNLEQAQSFKAVWLKTFPEFAEYLTRYVRERMRDEAHSSSERERFSYFSPLGTYRARCSFTEAANGFALQTPAAEGMKLAWFNLQRAMWDLEVGSCLYGCRGKAAVHDEALIEMPDDRWLHERAFEAARIWVEGMNVVCPDALVKADPAAMHRWDKNAESCYNKEERLQVWDPSVKYWLDDKGRFRLPE